VTDKPTKAAAGQRLDKWLWFTRAFKSRTIAADFVSTGKLRVNGDRVTKPSHTLKAGDTVTFVAFERARVLRMVAPGERRGPVEEAAALYEDLSPPVVKPDKDAQENSGRRDAGAGRPTKRDRREMDKWRGGGND
jgi:ribosome-associated heat shock protein Hsp15